MKSVLVSVLIDARGYMFVSTLLALSMYLSTDIAYIVEKTEKYIDPPYATPLLLLLRQCVGSSVMKHLCACRIRWVI